MRIPLSFGHRLKTSREKSGVGYEVVRVQIYTLSSPTPYSLPPTPFLTALTTVMFAAFSFRVTVGAGIAAIVFTVFFNGIAQGNDTHARITGTFH